MSNPMSKPYKFAVVCGRLQPLHNGHKAIIDKALYYADKVALYLGSCNNVGTIQNPLTYRERLQMVYSVYKKEIRSSRLVVKPLFDRKEVKNDNDWGKYYLDKIQRDFNMRPDLFVYGNDKERNQWFTEEDLKCIDTLIVNRDAINISATSIRTMIIEANYEEYRKYVPSQTLKYYFHIRTKLLSIINKNISEDKKNGKKQG